MKFILVLQICDKFINLLQTYCRMNNALTFLIVDDDADDCEFFCEAVSEINPHSRCLLANNGEDALMKLRTEMTNLPDLIFLDLNMHRMDGRKCLIELKKDSKLKNIPVIILLLLHPKKISKKPASLVRRISLPNHLNIRNCARKLLMSWSKTGRKNPDSLANLFRYILSVKIKTLSRSRIKYYINSDSRSACHFNYYVVIRSRKGALRIFFQQREARLS